MEWCCICRLGGIGDNLIAASVLPALAQRYQVEVISQAPNHVVFEGNPYISKLTVRQPGDLPGEAAAWQHWFADRAREYALFVNLSHSCETMLAFGPGQTQFYWPAAWRRQWCDKSYLELVADIVGVPCDPGALFFATEEERNKAEETRRSIKPAGPMIGWFLSGTRLDKVYPYAPMVIARLIRELDASVLLFGLPGRETEMARMIQEHVVRQNGSDSGLHAAISVDPAAPNWPLRRSLTMAQTCDLVIGPDTGPMWAVAMEAVPKVMLLSHASADNITKHWENTTTLHADPGRVPCWPCHRLHDDQSTCTTNRERNGAACISDVDAETLVATARQILGV